MTSVDFDFGKIRKALFTHKDQMNEGEECRYRCVYSTNLISKKLRNEFLRSKLCWVKSKDSVHSQTWIVHRYLMPQHTNRS